MEFSKEQLAKAAKCETVEELAALAKAEGFDITEEQAEAFFAVTREGELSDGELDSVAGGATKHKGSWYGSVPPHYLITTVGNSCRLFNREHIGPATCCNCYERKMFDYSMSLYCTKRTLHNDPIKK